MAARSRDADESSAEDSSSEDESSASEGEEDENEEPCILLSLSLVPLLL